MRDSQGTERFAPLFFVSPTQINFQVPPGTVAARALVTVIRGGETVAAGSDKIDMISGATYTSQGYIGSLQSALNKAGL